MAELLWMKKSLQANVRFWVVHKPSCAGRCRTMSGLATRVRKFQHPCQRRVLGGFLLFPRKQWDWLSGCSGACRPLRAQLPLIAVARLAPQPANMGAASPGCGPHLGLIGRPPRPNADHDATPYDGRQAGGTPTGLLVHPQRGATLRGGHRALLTHFSGRWGPRSSFGL